METNWTTWAEGMRGVGRGNAEFAACVALVQDVAAFAPVGTAYSLPLSIRGLHDCVTIDHIRDHLRAVPERPRDFGRWRAHVTEIEAVNAGRLSTVWSALIMLSRTEPAPKDRALVDGLKREIREILLSRWRLAGDVAETWRTDAIKRTRRYDLLPALWRFV